MTPTTTFCMGSQLSMNGWKLKFLSSCKILFSNVHSLRLIVFRSTVMQRTFTQNFRRPLLWVFQSCMIMSSQITLQPLNQISRVTAQILQLKVYSYTTKNFQVHASRHWIPQQYILCDPQGQVIQLLSEWNKLGGSITSFIQRQTATWLALSLDVWFSSHSIIVFCC
jgi:hypothetical protein